jgi:hypothetical protein
MRHFLTGGRLPSRVKLSSNGLLDIPPAGSRFMTPLPYALPQRSSWLGLGLWVALAFAASLIWLLIPTVYIGSPRVTGAPAAKEGFIPYSNSGKFGYTDPSGNNRITPRFDGADGFCEGRARVLLNGRFGFIDTSGTMVIPARFAWASAFRGGYTSVWTGSDWDYLDREGRQVVIFPKHAKPSQARSL